MQHYKISFIVFFSLSIILPVFFPTLAQANETSDYQLFESIEAVNIEGAREALNKGANPNARDPRHKGHFKTLKSLMIMLPMQQNEKNRQMVFDIAKLL